MAEQAHGNAVHTEGEVIAGTTVDGADPVHAAPAAFGMDATMWVALAMLVVIGIAIWQKVPALVAGILDKQIAAIREQLDQATTLRKEAEALKGEYEAKARAAEADAAAMKAHAEEEAKQIVTKAKADAAALIDRRAKAAGEKIAAAERAAIADVRTHAATLAAAAAAQLIAANHDAKADKAIIDATISGLN